MVTMYTCTLDYTVQLVNFMEKSCAIFINNIVNFVLDCMISEPLSLHVVYPNCLIISQLLCYSYRIPLLSLNSLRGYRVHYFRLNFV